MMKEKMFKTFKYGVQVFLAAIFFIPFYVSIVYSFKNAEETARSPFSLPKILHFENYTRAIEVSNFFSALKNSIIVTIGVVVIITLFCSMAGYAIARGRSKIYTVLYYMFLTAIILPFQVVMFPLYQTLKQYGLLNTHTGLILAIAGFQIGFTIFLYTGFVKSIPLELEEAAKIDGCNQFQTFFKIIFPLLKPINATSVVFAAITAWNDFAISIIVVQKPEVRTLPLTQFFFVGQYSIEMNMAFAAFTLSMIPIVILFIFGQRYIVSGVTAGAVKG